MAYFVLLIKAVSIIVIVDALSSWVVRDENRFPRNITGPITAPLYAPIRMILNPQKLGGIDLSPLIVLFALQALANFIGGRGLF